MRLTLIRIPYRNWRELSMSPVGQMWPKPGLVPPARRETSRASPFPLFSATRKVAKCPEYRHVVPSHPPLCDLSSFDAEHGPEIKLRLATRRRERAHWSLLRALIRGPCSDEIPFSDQMLDRLHRIGK